MNDAPASSAAIASSSRITNDLPSEDVIQDETPTRAQVEERKKRNRQTFNRKRGQLLDDLLQNLDILVYAQLSAVYYMDNSFLRLLLRMVVHFALLTPKPDSLPQPPDQQPFVGAIFGTNLFCILLHIWLNPAVGTEATRGYLHGGVAMDFVGQKGPASKITLVLFDLVVLALQLVHLSAHIARKRLKDGPGSTSTSSSTVVPATSSTQDIDSEERGVRRSAEIDEEQGIEMQTLNPPSTTNTTTDTTANTEAAPADDEDEPTERDELLASITPRADTHIFDAFHSGQIVLSDLNVWRTTKEQFWAYHKSTPEERGARRATYRAQLASGLVNLRLGRFS